MLCYARLRALPIDHNSSHSKIENDYSIVYVLRSVAIVMQYLPLQRQVALRQILVLIPSALDPLSYRSKQTEF